MARLFGDYTDRSYETPMYKSLDIREPRYKVIILVAPIVPLSRGLTVYKNDNFVLFTIKSNLIVRLFNYIPLFSFDLI